MPYITHCVDVAMFGPDCSTTWVNPKPKIPPMSYRTPQKAYANILDTSINVRDFSNISPLHY